MSKSDDANDFLDKINDIITQHGKVVDELVKAAQKADAAYWSGRVAEQARTQLGNAVSDLSKLNVQLVSIMTDVMKLRDEYKEDEKNILEKGIDKLEEFGGDVKDIFGF